MRMLFAPFATSRSPWLIVEMSLNKRGRCNRVAECLYNRLTGPHKVGEGKVVRQSSSSKCSMVNDGLIGLSWVCGVLESVDIQGLDQIDLTEFFGCLYCEGGRSLGIG